MIRSVFLIVPLLLVSSAAQAQSTPNLSLRDRQHLSRDLTPSSSQDFFNQGLTQFEREIQLLERRFMAEQEHLLKIDPKLRDQEIQSDRSSRSRMPISVQKR
ncbi:MAG: hypothetical protein MUC48_04410 [Leptolyngbya sp. Prado105]|jgi:hypothetical protein|nr:hypothetical protein [Leptolyngbya sp. Prado105]